MNVMSLAIPLLMLGLGMGQKEPLPRGPGLSARYPGDAGMGVDRGVLLVEGFDEESVEPLKGRWSSISDEGGKVVSLSEDVPFPALGGRSVRLVATPGQNTGGHLYTRLPREVDTAHVRFYVKFPSPPGYIHHFVHFGGYRPATPWPQGGAGTKPNGDERVTVGIEPFGRDGRVPPPGEWNLYTYWHEMKGSADGRFWGNGLSPIEGQKVPVDRWQCVELMIRLNTPGERDGALALWLDGEPVADFRAGVPRGPWTGLGFRLREEGGEPFEGFDFRTTDELKVNFLWLLHYVTDTSNRRNRIDDPLRPVPVLFDHVVVATSYIGPLVLPPEKP